MWKFVTLLIHAESLVMGIC